MWCGLPWGRRAGGTSPAVSVKPPGCGGVGGAGQGVILQHLIGCLSLHHCSPSWLPCRPTMEWFRGGIRESWKHSFITWILLYIAHMRLTQSWHSWIWIPLYSPWNTRFMNYKPFLQSLCKQTWERDNRTSGLGVWGTFYLPDLPNGSILCRYRVLGGERGEGGLGAQRGEGGLGGAVNGSRWRLPSASAVQRAVQLSVPSADLLRDTAGKMVAHLKHNLHSRKIQPRLQPPSVFVAALISKFSRYILSLNENTDFAACLCSTVIH